MDEISGGDSNQNVPQASSTSAFSQRNSREALISVKERFEEEKKPLTEEEEAMVFISKVTTLNNIPNGVTDLLLAPENFKKLTLLSGQKMVTIERKVAQRATTYGHDVDLKSGDRIRYLPVVHTLLRELQGNVAVQGELILYWDGFRKFRAKGGTLGNPPLLFSCLLSLLTSVVSGALYFALLPPAEADTAIKEEDLRLITLIPKTDHYVDNIMEVLNFICEDLEVLYSRTLLGAPLRSSPKDPDAHFPFSVI